MFLHPLFVNITPVLHLVIVAFGHKNNPCSVVLIAFYLKFLVNHRRLLPTCLIELAENTFHCFTNMSCMSVAIIV